MDVPECTSNDMILQREGSDFQPAFSRPKLADFRMLYRLCGSTNGSLF